MQEALLTTNMNNQLNREANLDQKGLEGVMTSSESKKEEKTDTPENQNKDAEEMTDVIEDPLGKEIKTCFTKDCSTNYDVYQIIIY